MIACFTLLLLFLDPTLPSPPPLSINVVFHSALFPVYLPSQYHPAANLTPAHSQLREHLPSLPLVEHSLSNVLHSFWMKAQDATGRASHVLSCLTPVCR